MWRVPKGKEKLLMILRHYMHLADYYRHQYKCSVTVSTSSLSRLLKKSYTDSSASSCFPLTNGSLSIKGNNDFENRDCLLIKDINPVGS